MWRFAAGQATGSAHEKLKTPCQDRFACAVIAKQSTFVGAIADGAGSAEFAHIGAELAVSTVSSIAQLGLRAGRSDYQSILREASSIARVRLVDEAHRRSIPLRELACTLLAVIAAPVGGAALQIGDGVIVTREAGRDWQWMFWPQKGEYANATNFLTDEDALATAQLAALPNETQDVALTTDGLEALALQYAARKAHEPFFRTAFAAVHAARDDGELAALSSSLSEFLRSPVVRARTDDDASLVLATRAPRES